MRIISIDSLRKDIHFPIVRAVYESSEKNSWFKQMRLFFTYRRKFEVMEDYILWVPLLNAYIFVPSAFIFDGASVPKMLNGLYSPTGMLLLGALPHDFGFRYQCLVLINPLTGELYTKTFTKKRLDLIFKHLCSLESNMLLASNGAKLGLSVFGFIGWNSNRKLNKNLRQDFPSLFADIRGEYCDEEKER